MSGTVCYLEGGPVREDGRESYCILPLGHDGAHDYRILHRGATIQELRREIAELRAKLEAIRRCPTSRGGLAMGEK